MCSTARVARVLGVCAVLLVTPRALAQSSPGAEATLAYRALVGRIDSYGQGDGLSYAVGLAPQLDCWFGRANVPRARAVPSEDAHAGVYELTVVREAADDVTLLDRGWYATRFVGSGLHEKLVRLRRSGGAWLVVAMSSATRATGCRADTITTLPQSGGRFARCQALVPPYQARLLASACTGSRSGFHGCTETQDEATTLAPSCLFGKTFDLRRVTTPFASLHDVPWATLPRRGQEPAPSVVVYGDVDGDGAEDAVAALWGADMVVMSLARGELVELGSTDVPNELASPGCALRIRSLMVTGHAITGTAGPPATATQCPPASQPFSVHVADLMLPERFDLAGD